MNTRTALDLAMATATTTATTPESENVFWLEVKDSKGRTLYTCYYQAFALEVRPMEKDKERFFWRIVHRYTHRVRQSGKGECWPLETARKMAIAAADEGISEDKMPYCGTCAADHPCSSHAQIRALMVKPSEDLRPGERLQVAIFGDDEETTLTLAFAIWRQGAVRYPNIDDVALDEAQGKFLDTICDKLIYRKIDPARNPHALITSQARNTILTMTRTNRRRHERETKYYENQLAYA